MAAVEGIAQNWRAALLGALMLGFALLIVLALAKERSPADRLPLKGVPDSAYASAGVELYDASEDIVARESVAFGPKGAEFLARLLVCCGKPSQTVLVTLLQAEGDNFILAYALNYETDKAPESPPLGGHFVTAVTKDMDYFVAVLDAKTGSLIFRLQPDIELPFPSADQTRLDLSTPIVARNLDGPDVLVTLWTLRPETTVVECGEEQTVTSSQFPGGPLNVSVNDALTGKLLFERGIPAGSQKLILTIQRDGIVLGDEMSSSDPSRPRLPCR